MPRGYTVQYIIQRALEDIGNPDLDAIAFEKLDQILYTVYVDYTWDFLLKNTTLSFNASTDTPTAGLPTDYQKHFLLKFLDTSQSPTQEKPIDFLSIAEFSRLEFPLRESQQPQYYTVSPTTYSGSGQSAVLKIWPVFSADANSKSCKLYYYYLPPKLTTQTEYPLFPDHGFLIEALKNAMREYLHHPNFDPLFIPRYLKNARLNAQDTGGMFPAIAPLDPRRFK